MHARSFEYGNRVLVKKRCRPLHPAKGLRGLSAADSWNFAPAHILRGCGLSATANKCRNFRAAAVADYHKLLLIWFIMKKRTLIIKSTFLLVHLQGLEPWTP